ncbi:hypothetical protein [Pseudomonas sp. Pseu.R1]|uniref:hypothetical protein n=1 Tax=Pseudomonas sp. Pseu.R1 TaxID=3379818 RepID=UPI003B94D88A
MKPLNFALTWALFLLSFLVFAALTFGFLSDTFLWESLASLPFMLAEEKTKDMIYSLTALCIGVAFNIIFMRIILTPNRKMPHNKTAPLPSNGSKPDKKTLSRSRFITLWLLYLMPYVVFFIIILSLFPEWWIWELTLNTYDFIKDPLWDYLYEGFIAVLALLANTLFVYFSLSLLNRRRASSQQVKL